MGAAPSTCKNGPRGSAAPTSCARAGSRSPPLGADAPEAPCAMGAAPATRTPG
eukprot:CAMPEP_0194720440 /NCGR_PEP_ID=MMETSP0296-20130528/11774_1 /TAXON_ID=39354 /ORGANISM="Heterosigma akashiwo, Strain CCMP2393" /LENGTH=52 /DNA_ID=CAMNT_0039622603 /DNA_START=56 /DNA_END=210 /DNA_ORIENTATION=-